MSAYNGAADIKYCISFSYRSVLQTEDDHCRSNLSKYRWYY
jgi:hypothetical protein